MIQKRKIVGGLLAVGAAFGVWFSGLIPKFGTGTGVGTGTAISTDAGTGAKPATSATKTPGAATKPDATAKPADDKSKSTTAKKNATPTEKPAAGARNDVIGTLPDKLPYLEVFVKGSRYQIKDLKGSEMLYIKTDSLLELAKRTTGNEEGVRVRITRYRSAKYVAYSQLYEDLQGIGLKTDQIRMPKELVDDPITPPTPAKS